MRGLRPNSGIDDMTLEKVETNQAIEADIQLSGAKVGAVITAQLFGHNLEHTRRAIWRGLSAQMVANRKFAAVDSGLAKQWWTLADDGVSVDDEVAYAGRYSFRLDNQGGTNCGIWQQHDWLAFRQEAEYAFRVWARSEAAQTVRMRIVTRSGFAEVFAGETIVEPGSWQLWSGVFAAPCPARGGRLEISLATPGTVWIGAA